jgi:UDP-sugar pyrophosphorylase
LADLEESYPGGLPAYLTKARKLLDEAAAGGNPFADFTAAVPEGDCLTYEADHYVQAEERGLQAAGGLVFVLVAGGLGERLGYSGIKLSLDTTLCTEQTYLEFYIRYIQALQAAATPKAKIPLVIMTSGDTDPLTRQMLEENDYFGMKDDQLSIVMQDKVAALQDGYAGLALAEADRWTVQTKPHGHGDVHHLLLREGLIDQWEEEGKSHVVFLQDTNALVVHSILAATGVSVQRDFQMNSICIPRLAGEAAGAITSLEYVGIKCGCFRLKIVRCLLNSSGLPCFSPQ